MTERAADEERQRCLFCDAELVRPLYGTRLDIECECGGVVTVRRDGDRYTVTEWPTAKP